MYKCNVLIWRELRCCVWNESYCFYCICFCIKAKDLYRSNGIDFIQSAILWKMLAYSLTEANKILLMRFSHVAIPTNGFLIWFHKSENFHTYIFFRSVFPFSFLVWMDPNSRKSAFLISPLGGIQFSQCLPQRCVYNFWMLYTFLRLTWRALRAYTRFRLIY